MATMADQNGEAAATTTTTKRVTAASKENQQLACPRCDSSNTKFCYYNNYNFSQPRHFCKSCRRYWTHGGALRDIPVGGGSRRNASSSSTKRPRTSPSANSSPVFMAPATTNPLLLPFSTSAASPPPVASLGTFGSLLSAHAPAPSTGFLALGGFGFGLEDVGAASCFGLGRGISTWASFPDHLVDDGSFGGRVLNGSNGGSHTWQLESGGGGPFVGVGGAVGDCFPWPDLAISTPGHGLK